MKQWLYILVCLLPCSAFAQPQRIERNIARSKANAASAFAERSWKDGDLIKLQGRVSAGDEGGGDYYYDADSSATVDGVFTLPGVGGALSYNSNGTFNGTNGTGRIIAVNKKSVRLTQAGGVADWNGSSGTDSTAALKAAVAACQTVGATLVIDGRFRITDTITLNVNKPFTIIGRTGDATKSEIRLDTAVDNTSVFNFYSASSAAFDYYHIRDLHITTGGGGVNLSAFTWSDDGSTGRLGVKARFENLEINSSGYAFDFQEMSYQVQPVFRNIDVTGGGAIRITSSTTESYRPHTTSGMIIDGFHYSASNKLGAAFHLEGCRNATMRGVISEGSAAVDASISPYTGAIHLYVNDATNGLLIDNFWCETGSGTVEAGAVGIRVNHNATIGATVTIRNLKMDSDYYSVDVTGQSCHLNLQETFIDNAGVPTVTVEPGCRVSFSDCFFASPNYVRQLTETAGVRVVDPHVTDHILTLNKSTQFYDWTGTHELEPTIVYRYTGGYLANQYQRLRQVSGFFPTTNHKPQNDIDYGSTLVIDGNGNSVFIWQIPEDSSLGLRIEDFVGRQLFYRVVCRPLHASLASQTLEVQLSSSSGSEIGQGTITNDYEWTTIIGSHVIQSGDSFPRMIELDPAGTEPDYIQIAQLDIALDALPPPEVRRRAHCYTGSISGGPGEGTWGINDTVLSSNPATDGVHGWICTAAGTSRTIASVTCDTATGSPTISNVANISEIIPGDYITIAGVTGTFRVVSIDSATTATLSANADANTSGAAVSAYAPVWATLPSSDSAGYAQISIEDNATATTVASTQSDWSAKSQFVGFGTNFADSSNATPDHTNDHITLTSAGTWEVTCVVTLSGSVVSDLWELALWKNNGATQISTKQGVNIRGAGLTYEKQVTISGLVDASANDTIELWVQRTNGTGTLTITNAVMTAKKVSD